MNVKSCCVILLTAFSLVTMDKRQIIRFLNNCASCNELSVYVPCHNLQTTRNYKINIIPFNPELNAEQGGYK